MYDEPWPEVPGYVVLPGASPPDDPDVAPAVEQGTRRRVLLRRLPELRPDERPAIARALSRYADVSSDDLAEPATLAEGADVLVLSTAGRTLADRSVAPRTTGQLVTALVPVASALEAIHAAGLGHGVVDRRAVVVDDEGRPRLADTGVAAALRVLAPREIPEPGAAGDLTDLRRLALRLAERVADPAVAEAFADPAVPATAHDAVEMLLDLAPPEPLPGAVSAGTAAAAGAVLVGSPPSARTRRMPISSRARPTRARQRRPSRSTHGPTSRNRPSRHLRVGARSMGDGSSSRWSPCWRSSWW